MFTTYKMKTDAIRQLAEFWFLCLGGLIFVMSVIAAFAGVLHLILMPFGCSIFTVPVCGG